MELLTESGVLQAERERAYEYGLPDYLQHDLDAYKEGLKSHSGLLDCLWGELYGSINMAEIAPVFACGSCLLPQADDKVMRKVLANAAELHARVFQFPTSALKQNGRKINYYDF